MIRAALDAISLWAIPVLLVAIPLVGLLRKVKVYDVFIEGAKEGFDVAVRIIPFLVGILVAIGMFRGSGAMDLLDRRASARSSTTTGFPAELVPLAMLRSLTGSGSLAFTTDLIKTHGPDSVIGTHGRHDLRIVRDHVLRAGRLLRRRRCSADAPRGPGRAHRRHRRRDRGGRGLRVDVLEAAILQNCHAIDGCASADPHLTSPHAQQF